MTTTIFMVENSHSVACGEPPAWTMGRREPQELRGYFENRHGEQWIAFATADLFILTGGDIDWQTRRIAKPDYAAIAADGAAALTLVLSHEEALWLNSVLVTASHRWVR